MPRPAVPVYFSHSYRAADRDLNQFFWELFCKAGFYFTVDPKSDVVSVPHLQLMMKRSACFAAVVTLREEQETYRCSPFIVYEYGLAVQARKPRLVFVEQDVAGRFFEQGPTTIPFERNQRVLSADRARFRAALRTLADQSRTYSDIGRQLRGSVGLLVDATPGMRRVYASLVPRITDLLLDQGYRPVVLDLQSTSNLELTLQLDSLQFMILDVGPNVLPAWVYPFIEGRFIPAIKLFHLTNTQLEAAALSPLLTGELVTGEAVATDQILFWHDEHELLNKLNDQLVRFDTGRAEFSSLEDGHHYFRSIGRRRAKVFVSNFNDANEFAARLSRALNLENIEHFQYRYRNLIRQGSEWRDQLRPQIEDCEIFVQLLTGGYAQSTYCKEEHTTAEELRAANRLEILPYFLDDASRSFDVRVQAVDLVGNSDDERIQTIISTLDARLREARPAARATADVHSVDVAIICLHDEVSAAVAHRVDRHEPAPIDKPPPAGCTWDVGEIKTPRADVTYRVVIVAAAASDANTAGAIVRSTVERWSARYVLIVGLADGLQVDGLKRGDLVISSVVCELPEGLGPVAERSWPADAYLVTAAKVLPLRSPGWRAQMRERSPSDGLLPALVSGPIASVSTVAGQVPTATIQAALSRRPRLVALTESRAASAAAVIKELRDGGRTLGMTDIRGIVGLLGPKNEQTGAHDVPREPWEKFACEAVADFVVELIRHSWPVPPIGVD